MTSSLLVTGVLVAGVLAAPAGAASTDPEESSSPGYSASADGVGDTESTGVGFYQGDPENEALLVDLEERRLLDIQLVAAGILVPTLDVGNPFRVTGSAVSTLVLPARESAYSLQELAALSPATVSQVGNGVFVLNESLAVMEGATLDLRSRGSLTVRLVSRREGFTSIVSLGGTLLIHGDPGALATITSWDPTLEEPDRVLGDGRAYIRALGGSFAMDQARIAEMGFWSGTTGGLALTGLEETIGLGLGVASDGVTPGVAESLGVTTDQTGEVIATPSAEPDSSSLQEDGGIDAQPVTPPDSETNLGAIETAAGSDLLPAGITAKIASSTMENNAFGLFVSNSSSIEVRDSVVKGSLVDGIVLHREVERAQIINTSSTRNAGDGVRISRGSSGVSLDTVTADLNGGSGIVINAGPLAVGPSAVGLSPQAYGGHAIRNATLVDNAAHGLIIKGGDGILVSDSQISGSEFGLVVAEQAQNIRLEDNTVSDTPQQGIALRDGVTAIVSGNTVEDTKIGIYTRDSAATIDHNDLADINGHGVTVIGTATGTVIEDNRVAGLGSSAVDVARATGVEVDPKANELSDWRFYSLWEQIGGVLTRPLTLMWLILAAILVFTAFAGFHRGPRTVGLAPYRDRRPLTAISKGVADPSTIPGVTGIPHPAAHGGLESLPRRVRRDAERHGDVT